MINLVLLPVTRLHCIFTSVDLLSFIINVANGCPCPVLSFDNGGGCEHFLQPARVRRQADCSRSLSAFFAVAQQQEMDELR